MKLLTTLFLLFLPLLTFAHGGEDHGDGAAARAPVADHPRFEAQSPDLELVAELHGANLTLYLDRYATNQPVLDAKIEIEGDNQKATATLLPDGSYTVPAPWLAQPGKHELVVTVQAGDLDDLLIGALEVAAPAAAHASVTESRSLLFGGAGLLALLVAAAVAHLASRRRKAGSLLLPLLILALPATLLAPPKAYAHGGEDHGDAPHPPATGQPTRLADGSVYVPKNAQRTWGIRTEIAAVGEHPYSVELNGHVVADPSFSGRVQSSQSGRIETGTPGLPHLGKKVSKGEVLAWLMPVASSLERGGSQSQLADIASQRDLAEKRVARLTQLEGVTPQRELDTARAELRSLDERKAALSGALNAREALRAPVSGVVSAVNVSVGQVVEARETLFEIVNPDKLWVEAIAYDPALPTQIASASAAGADGAAFRLIYLGGGAELREHALPLQFRIVPPLPPLNVAQPVRVAVATNRRVNAVAVPRDAVVRNTGSDTFVWLHFSAERFVPRRIRTQTLDAARLAIPEGVQAGERIVTQGAALLNQVR